MRTSTAIAIPLIALALLAALAPGVLAAPATTETFRERFQLIDDHGDEAYIFDVEMVVHITTRPDGTASYTNNTRQVQTHTVAGVVVDVIESNMAQHSLWVAEQEVTVQSHSSQHDRYAAGDDRCQTTIVWQVVDDELVVQHFKSVCP
jgi:hypothetical protein